MAEIVPPCVETDAWESFVTAMNAVCRRGARGLYPRELRRAHEGQDPEWLASIEAEKAAEEAAFVFGRLRWDLDNAPAVLRRLKAKEAREHDHRAASARKNQQKGAEANKRAAEAKLTPEIREAFKAKRKWGIARIIRELREKYDVRVGKETATRFKKSLSRSGT